MRSVRSTRLRQLAAALSMLLFGSGLAPAQASLPDPSADFSPTPGVACRSGDLTESTQGRVPAADFASGRAALGYTCNADQVSHVGSEQSGTGGGGGYRVFRYTDTVGHTCVFYDTTLLFPANVRTTAAGGTGVWVLDVSDPANPRHVATLATPAMQSPHESLSLNARRGLLGAVFANPGAHAGQFDLYDVSRDCLHPALASSTPTGILGHEGSFSPDGDTYYSASLYGHTLTAIDTKNILAPTIVWASAQWNVHGLNLNDDGTLMYFADVARNRADAAGPIAGSESKGLTVIDVSEVQARVLNPQVRIVSHLTWPHVSTPQTNIPVTLGGRKRLIEVDEFGSGDKVGAARIIDIQDPAAPYVVANMRLAVNNADHQGDGSQSKDPNAANSLAGYAGHYCGVPTQNEPTIVACSFILSGLRVFNIADPEHPKEIAYFNMPATSAQTGTGTPAYGAQGAYAMSQPAFDVARHQITYSDGNTGLYVVQIDPSVWS